MTVNPQTLSQSCPRFLLRQVKHLVIFIAAVLLLFDGSELRAQQAIWIQANGAYQGSIHATAISAKGVLLIGTEGDGIFRSSNDGGSWAQINVGITNFYISAIEISKKGTAFASAYLYSGGLYRSTDLGTTWNPVPADLTERHVTSLAISPDDAIFAGTSDSGLYRSIDDGLSWQHVGSGLPAEAILSLSATSGGLMFAGTVTSGIYRSTDTGAHWSQTNYRSHAVYALLTQPSGVVVAGTTLGAIYSTDSGATWKSGFVLATSVLSLATNQDGTIFAGTANEGVYVSTDLGAHWKQQLTGLESPYVNSLATKGSHEVMAGTLHGIFLSHDTAATWEATHTALGNDDVRSLTESRTGLLLAGTNGSGVYSSSDNGESWQASSNRLTDSIITTLTVTRSGAILATGLQKAQSSTLEVGGIYRSTDEAFTWQESSRPGFRSPIYSVAETPQGNIFAASASEGVFSSNDDGVTWSRLSLDSGKEYELASDSIGLLYALVSAGEVLRSTDQGATWTSVYVHRSGRPSIVVSSIGTIVIDGARSTNEGASWQPDTLTGEILSATTDGALFAKQSDQLGVHLFRSQKQGLDAKPFDAGLFPADQRSQYQLTCLAESQDGYLFAGTNFGVHKTLKPQSQLAVASQDHLASIALQNYPNPVRGSTLIRYHLTEPSPVVITVTDLLGNERVRVSLPAAATGVHEYPLDATPLAPGIYFFSIRTRSEVQVSRMIVSH